MLDVEFQCPEMLIVDVMLNVFEDSVHNNMEKSLDRTVDISEVTCRRRYAKSSHYFWGPLKIKYLPTQSLFIVSL